MRPPPGNRLPGLPNTTKTYSVQYLLRLKIKKSTAKQPKITDRSSRSRFLYGQQRQTLLAGGARDWDSIHLTLRILLLITSKKVTEARCPYTCSRPCGFGENKTNKKNARKTPPHPKHTTKPIAARRPRPPRDGVL